MSRRVAVVGAGLAGVSSAFELASLGMAVTVFERGGGVAEQASFAGSGLLSHPDWLTLGERLSAPLTWRWRRWRAERGSDLTDARAAALRLTTLGHARVVELRRHLQIADDSSTALLLLCADEARRQALAPLWAAPAESTDSAAGADWLDEARVRQHEAGLNAQAALRGGWRLRPGGSGNARLFAQALRSHAQRLGVEFHFHTTVRQVRPGSTVELTHEYTPPAEPTRREAAPREAGDTLPSPPGAQTERFDAVLLCTGLDARPLLAAQGRRLPLAALHEASVTAPLRLLEAHPELGPQAAVLDPERGCSIARIGQRVRVTGSRQVGHPDAQAPAAAFEGLHRSLQHWFPGSVLHQQVQQGQSRRALAPDGLPVVGASGLDGVWLSLSNGLSGWGLTVGASMALAEQIAGRAGSLDITTLDARRLA